MFGSWRGRANQPSAPPQGSQRPQFVPCRWCGYTICRGAYCRGPQQRRAEGATRQGDVDAIVQQLEELGQSRRADTARLNIQANAQETLRLEQEAINTKLDRLPSQDEIRNAISQAAVASAQLAGLVAKIGKTGRDVSSLRTCADELAHRLGKPTEDGSIEGMGRLLGAVQAALETLKTECEGNFTEVDRVFDTLADRLQRLEPVFNTFEQAARAGARP